MYNSMLYDFLTIASIFHRLFTIFIPRRIINAKLIKEDDRMLRCAWCGTDGLYVRYHDEDWGKPVHDDWKHFEYMVLDSAQAGLSWYTILRKRENYRRAYAGFDPAVVASYGSDDIARLLEDSGIVRNRLKVLSSVANAKSFLHVQAEFGSFDKYIWSFTGGQTEIHDIPVMSATPCSTELSDRISKDLKKRGFSFVGTTIIYAYLQAAGIVDDHENTCSFKARP
jgi:DNA-3-methyladenine glycosylase I